MSKVPAEIFPSLSFEVVISQIASFSEKAFGILKDEIESDSAFDVDKERCERLSRALDVSPESVALLLGALSFLFDRVSVLPSDIPSKEEVFARFVEEFDEVELGADSKKLLIARLNELTAANTKIEFWAKIRRLKFGFLDNAKRFGSFVDLRPDYTPDYGAIRGFIPMVQFRVTTDSEDLSKRDFVFQLDEDALAGLKKAVEGAQSKLETLKRPNALAASILFGKKTAQ